MGLVSASKVVPLVSPHGKETKTKKFSQLPAPSQSCLALISLQSPGGPKLLIQLPVSVSEILESQA